MQFRSKHNLAKVGVEGSNPFACSNFPQGFEGVTNEPPQGGFFVFASVRHLLGTGTDFGTRYPLDGDVRLSASGASVVCQ